MPHKYPRLVSLMACTAALAIPFAAHTLTQCLFHRAGGSLFDPGPVMTRTPEAAITSVVRRADRRPSCVWGGTMTFELDILREIEPDALDAALVRKAAAILSSEHMGNRADHRRCAAGATPWSLSCATEKTTIGVTGGFHHRRRSIESARTVVDQRTEGRPSHHRLMDDNNHPTDPVSDVRSLVAVALAQIERDRKPV
ncbi:MAG: hypothetical protein ACLGXA_12600 [Acidobacteriota bacterium]